MAVNKVIYGGETVVDLTTDTVTAAKMLSGTTAHDKSGNKVTGTIPTKTASNMTVSGATVTAPAGYYASAQSKSVATATQATPSISVDSAGKITASATQTAGYVYAGTKTATKQLTTQAAKTVTPSTSSQTAVASGVYTTGAITVGAIPSTYVKPTATKAATTYTPTVSDQSIAAGTYCSGTQTIKGDANLIPENIASGVSIFGVEGTMEAGGGGGGGNYSTITINNHTPYRITFGAYIVFQEYSAVVPVPSGDDAIYKLYFIIETYGEHHSGLSFRATVNGTYMYDILYDSTEWMALAYFYHDEGEGYFYGGEVVDIEVV